MPKETIDSPLVNGVSAPSAPLDLEGHIRVLKPGDHICLVYETEEEQMAAVVPFVKAGLARGERVLYIADDRTMEQVASHLAAAGVDVAREKARGALTIFTKRETYLRSGAFDPKGMVQALAEATRQALADGFTGLCVTGEMTWALGPEPGCDRLVEYEAHLNTFFPGSRSLAICQYNSRRFHPRVINDVVLRTHPIAILGNQVCPNLYYEPPEQVLANQSDAHRTQWMIGQLKRARQAQEEVQALNRALEKRVHERTVQLESSNRDLEAFSYSVSHDLRAPLRAIKGFVAVLEEDAGSKLDPDEKTLLARVNAACVHMESLIEGLLNLSRLSRKEPARLPVDLSERAAQIFDGLRRDAPDRRVEAVVAPGGTAHGDPELLDAVLQNLLENAWKFTARRPEARIEFGFTGRGPSRTFYVRDNGVGFKPAQARQLFTPFQRLHDAADYPGTGIGLATAQRIIRRHGGEMWAEGDEGQGATFFFRLGPADRS